MARQRPGTFSKIKSFGLVSMMARRAWGNILRSSLKARALPPIEKGWQGGPPLSKVSSPWKLLKLIVLTSDKMVGAS